VSPLIPIEVGASAVDLSPRIVQSNAVAASPAAATETTICTLTIRGDIAQATGVILLGFAAFTVGTSGTACNLKIRQTNTSGTTVGATGATTGGIAATNLVDMNVAGFDAASVGAQVYVLTLTVTNGAAASTVSAAQLVAIVV
jgi:hypothetical protein